MIVRLVQVNGNVVATIQAGNGVLDKRGSDDVTRGMRFRHTQRAYFSSCDIIDDRGDTILFGKNEWDLFQFPGGNSRAPLTE